MFVLLNTCQVNTYLPVNRQKVDIMLNTREGQPKCNHADIENTCLKCPVYPRFTGIIPHAFILQDAFSQQSQQKNPSVGMMLLSSIST